MPRTPGTVVAHFTIGEPRRAQDVRAVGSTATISACIAAALSDVRTENAPDVGDVDVTGSNPLSGKHHRLESRSAHFVDRQRGDVVGKTTAQSRLTCRRLAEARRHDVPHDAFVNARRVDSRTGNRLADNQSAELSC